MADEVKVGEISKELNELLKEYGDEVVALVNEQVKDVAKDTVKMLKKTSPKDQGDYVKGWKSKAQETSFGETATVYNSTHGWLVHLLEHGHAKKSGGRTKAQPHVKPAENWAEKELIKRIKERLSK